jgi:drug/metabolite transporter (DMT)-like permease
MAERDRVRPPAQKSTSVTSARPTPAPPSGASVAHRIGLAWLAVAALAYGGLWPVMRLTVVLMEPFWFAVTRLGIGALFMFAMVAVTGRLRLPGRGDITAILSVGIFMMGLYVSIVHVAIQYVPAGRGALLAYSTPLWVTPMATLLLREPMTKMKTAGLVLGLSGLFVLFSPQALDWTDPDVLLGNGLCLLAAFSWSFAILHMRVHRAALSPVQLAPWQLTVATIVALPFAVVFEGTPDYTPGLELGLLIAYGGLIGTGIAMWSAQSAMRNLPAVSVSTGLLGGPAVALLISVAFLDETLTLSLALGIVLILGGIACISIGGARKSA